MYGTCECMSPTYSVIPCNEHAVIAVVGREACSAIPYENCDYPNGWSSYELDDEVAPYYFSPNARVIPIAGRTSYNAFEFFWN
jgi:hypothetical protein